MTKQIEFPQSRCRVGVARGDVTPPVGIYHRMWGAATHDQSVGVHRPLTATVLIFESLAASDSDGSAANSSDLKSSIHSSSTKDVESNCVFIALDHCLLWPMEMGELLNSISQSTGYPVESITVFFSHTHGAGLMGMERQGLPGGEMIPKYLDELAAALSELVYCAQSNLESASIVYGTGRCGLATNRDFYDEERQHFVCGFNPDGISDDCVVVGKVVNDDGCLRATIVNYACHPTTLAWENQLISPDYVGAMRELIE
ncbi:MAG: hypothetical protein FJ267_18315, partial [Planctomycetes bacterium]|nr:hypothetical protein [Planctomycetota bacterium]